MRRYRVIHRDVYEEHDILMVGVVRTIECKTWIGAWLTLLWVWARYATEVGEVSMYVRQPPKDLPRSPYR